MTSVEHRVSVWKSKTFQAKSAETISEGMTISSKAQMGVRVRGSTSATFSGNNRSKAAAKMTRVELRKTVPDQPNHQALMARMTMNWMIRLGVMNTASRAG
jgi:hypothetical protein